MERAKGMTASQNTGKDAKGHQIMSLRTRSKITVRFRKKTPTERNPQGKTPQGYKPPIDCQRDINSIKIN